LQAHKAGRRAGRSAREKHRDKKGESSYEMNAVSYLKGLKLNEQKERGGKAILFLLWNEEHLILTTIFRMSHRR